jgi:hypothetical protein
MAGAPTRGAAAEGRRSVLALRSALDDRWDQQMTHLLREAAEVREGRDRARSSEDDLLARREATAIRDLIRSHARPRAKHYDLRAIPKGGPGPAKVMP